MKYNYNNFLKKNYLFTGLLVFAYLFYIINNNNFYESFIIFIILILGYLLINFKIFYILLLLIIVSNLFFNFNKLIEGNTSGCQYISDPIKKIVEQESRKRDLLTTTSTRNGVKRIDRIIRRDSDDLGKKALQSAISSREFKRIDDNTSVANISQQCANKMTQPKVYIPKRNYQKSVCSQPSPSEFTESDLRDIR